jgi:hypothetical protein
MLSLALALLFQSPALPDTLRPDADPGLVAPAAVKVPAADTGSGFVARFADSAFAGRSILLSTPRWEPAGLSGAVADTGRRRRFQTIEYSDTYHTRVAIHRALSFAMIPLFVGSAYTGFQLRSKGYDAPKWTRDLHGPIAAGTAIVFGMNTLTGVWNLWEGRKDPEDRSRRLVHSVMFLAAAAGFTYVTTAGDNIYSSGKGNHWHRDIALASMTVSVVSWSLMIFH